MMSPTEERGAAGPPPCFETTSGTKHLSETRLVCGELQRYKASHEMSLMSPGRRVIPATAPGTCRHGGVSETVPTSRPSLKMCNKRSDGVCGRAEQTETHRELLDGGSVWTPSVDQWAFGQTHYLQRFPVVTSRVRVQSSSGIKVIDIHSAK